MWPYSRPKTHGFVNSLTLQSEKVPAMGVVVSRFRQLTLLAQPHKKHTSASWAKAKWLPLSEILSNLKMTALAVWPLLAFLALGWLLYIQPQKNIPHKKHKISSVLRGHWLVSNVTS